MHKDGIRQPVTRDVKHPELFSAPSELSCENEVKGLLVALTYLLKPDIVLEVGVAEGFTAQAIGSELAHNGVGHLHALDINLSQIPAEIRDALAPLPVSLHEINFMAYEPPGIIDLAFLDATLDQKDDEVLHFRPWFRKGTILVLHNMGYGRGGDMKYPKRAEGAFGRVPAGLYRRIHLPSPAGVAVVEWL